MKEIETLLSPEEIDQFKATMKLFGYSWFQIRRYSLYGDDIFVRERIYDATGWPALWAICKATGIYYGCGGTLYHQIKRGSLPLGDYTL